MLCHQSCRGERAKDMDLGSMLNIVKGGGLGVIVVMTLIQVAPIKVNPWSWLARLVGKACNGEIIEDIADIKKRIEKLDADQEEIRALSARTRILKFNDELLQNQRHSQEYFNQILDDIGSYQQYCDSHKEFKNEKAKLAIENVERCYRKCMEDRDFL